MLTSLTTVFKDQACVLRIHCKRIVFMPRLEANIFVYVCCYWCPEKNCHGQQTRKRKTQNNLININFGYHDKCMVRASKTTSEKGNSDENKEGQKNIGGKKNN